MKKMIRWATGILLVGLAVLPTQAAFKSLYIFGDSLSATADPYSAGPPYFYGQRDSNGRVWVEVLAQRQGLALYNTNNNSYWNHTSAQTVTDVNKFVAPPDVANDLFIVWVCNADTFDAATAQPTLTFAQWQATNALSQANHLQIITNLYAKGVRALILPNAVDLSEIPAFNASTLAPGMHNGCMDYNTQFSNTIAKAKVLCPNLKIYALDFFTLLNNVLANPASYGLTNALSAKGYSIDAYDDPAITTLTLDGPGTNFVFWDQHDPTAEFHEVIADIVQQSISPVQIGAITALNGSNQLDVANYPAGLSGFVDVSTNLAPASWTALQSITSTNTVQSVFVPQVMTTNVSGALSGGGNPTKADDSGNPGLLGGPPPDYIALYFYRLRFPYAWTWP